MSNVVSLDQVKVNRIFNSMKVDQNISLWGLVEEFGNKIQNPALLTIFLSLSIAPRDVIGVPVAHQASEFTHPDPKFYQDAAVPSYDLLVGLKTLAGDNVEIEFYGISEIEQTGSGLEDSFDTRLLWPAESNKIAKAIKPQILKKVLSKLSPRHKHEVTYVNGSIVVRFMQYPTSKMIIRKSSKSLFHWV